MESTDALTEVFARDRPRLHRIAQRMLGDRDQADDALQESWLKIDSIPQDDIRNASAWLTTITTRVCLDRLRQRRRSATASVALDDPAHAAEAAQLIGDRGPEHAALIADSIGVALLVVLERLGPLERVAFVLHDVFALGFDEIAPLIDRSPAAARQLASRARRKVRGCTAPKSQAIARHRALAHAFLRAAREGDMAGLLAILDPQVRLSADERAARMGSGPLLVGADKVAGFFAGRAAAAHVALINGGVGLIVAPADQLVLAVLAEFAGDRIVHLHAVAAPGDLAKLELRVAGRDPFSRLREKVALASARVG